MTGERPAQTGNSQERRAHTNSEERFLLFFLDQEEFGISIGKIKEIIGMMPFTPIPRTPDFVKGVINLRGEVVPVVDLRLKFGIKAAPYGQRACIVVTRVGIGEEAVSMGVVVDAVNEVANLKPEEVDATPDFGVRLDTSYILGLAKTATKVRILLDIDKVLAERDWAGLAV